LTFAQREVNGAPALAFMLGDQPYVVLQLETDGERVHTVAFVLNPDKLRHLV
jgi:hypothetical protein